MEALKNPVSDIVIEINITAYFVKGKYDGMTSPEAAEEYLNSLKGTGTHEMVMFENSAHYPQFEERDKFYHWMCDTFKRGFQKENGIPIRKISGKSRCRTVYYRSCGVTTISPGIR